MHGRCFALCLSMLSLSTMFATPSRADSKNLTRGIIRALDEAWLSSDLGLPIDQLPFKEGQSFRKGDLLVSFDCAAILAQKTAAQAKVQAESITFKNNKQLKLSNAIGQYDVDIAKARVDQAEAEYEGIAVTVRRCDIVAPFDGDLAQLSVHLFEIPERGTRMMQVLNSMALEVDMIVPSDWLKWLKPGSKFEVTIDELGTSAPAEVVRLAAAIDPISQTIKVVGRLTGDISQIRPGMSGALKFQDSP